MSALAVVTGSEERSVSDFELVAGVRAGDDRAFEQLFQRYQPRIGAYVAGMVRDHARAEDITQEVFLAALRRMRDGSDHEIQFRPWIYEIAKNKCIDAYRRGRHTVEVSFDAHEALGADEHSRLAGPRPTPDDAVEDKLALDNLCGAFGGLSPVHHDILVMREFEGLSYREIGERLGLSRPAVESTLFRARKRLSEEYEQLVSGERCRHVRRTVDVSRAIDGGGLREQRRIARHLAHCQPCRRYARLAGADLGELATFGRARTAAARIAALLPVPAFFRRRWDDDTTAGQLLGSQGGRPATQWWAQVAATLDPGVLTGWTKAVATAATVAVAGVGAGSAIGDRAGVPVQGAFAAPAVHAAGDRDRDRDRAGPPAATPRAISGALQTSGAPAAPPDVADGAGPAATTPPVAAAGAGVTAGHGSHPPAAATGTAALTTPATAAAERAGIPLEAASGGPVTLLLDRVIGDRRDAPTAPGGDRSSSQTAPSLATPLLSGDGLSRILSGGSALAAPSASEPSAPQAPSSNDTSSETSATGGALSAETAGEPTADGATVRPTVHRTITSTTAALTGLGG